jgi:protease-4
MRVLALALTVSAALSAGCLSVSLPGGGGPLRETVVLGREGPKIALVDIDGTLSTHGESGLLGLGRSESAVSLVREQLDLAREDDEVVGLLLRIDSPGGTVIASEILYQEVLRFRRETSRPVVAQLMGIATSGGYYVAMAADQVRAYPSTVTGSIGVIMIGLDASGLLEKVGVRDATITSGAFKDAGSPLRSMRPEERAHLQTVADDLYDGFLDAVEAGRPKLTRARIEELADGRVYSARQALAAGLVDELGDLPSAVDAVKNAAGVSGPARVVTYHAPSQEPRNLFSAAVPAAEPASQSPLRGLAGSSAPGFLYLWWPGVEGLPGP